MSVWVWIGVALLSGIAAIGRFLLLGLLTGLAVEGDALVLLGTATLGSYTTFSTWMLETQRLAEDGQIAVAAINILVSLVVGLGAIALGRAVGMHI